MAGHDATGRSNGRPISEAGNHSDKRERERRYKAGSPPGDESWFWLTEEFLEHLVTWPLSRGADLAFKRLILEHMRRGRQANGRLHVSHVDFSAAGMPKNSIRPAIDELRQRGIVATTPGVRGSGAKNAPTLFRLTIFHTVNPIAHPTNDWAHVTPPLTKTKRQQPKRSPRQPRAQPERRDDDAEPADRGRRAVPRPSRRRSAVCDVPRASTRYIDIHPQNCGWENGKVPSKVRVAKPQSALKSEGGSALKSEGGQTGVCVGVKAGKIRLFRFDRNVCRTAEAAE